MPLPTCPNCNVGMVPVERSGVEISVCPLCQGAWFDPGKFEALSQTPRQPPVSIRSPSNLRGKILGLAAVVVAIVVVGLGAAGYFIVRPLVAMAVEQGGKLVSGATPAAQDKLRDTLGARIEQITPQSAADTASKLTKSTLDRLLQEGQRLSTQLDKGETPTSAR